MVVKDSNSFNNQGKDIVLFSKNVYCKGIF